MDGQGMAKGLRFSLNRIFVMGSPSFKIQLPFDILDQAMRLGKPDGM